MTYSLSEYVLYINLRVFSLLFRMLPMRLALLIGRCLGMLYYFLDAKHARVAYRNLRIALSGEYSVGKLGFTLFTDSFTLKQDTTIQVILLTNSVRPSLAQQGILLYPNPVQDILFIKPLIINETDLSLTIYNTQGDIVYLNTMENIKSGDEKKLDVSALKAGLYFLQIRNDRLIRIEKFVKQ